MIISMEAEIAFDKNPTRFHDTYKKKKKLSKLGIEGNFLPMRKGIHEKANTNIDIQRKTESSPQRLGARQRRPLSSTLLSNTVLDILVRGKEKEMKGIQHEGIGIIIFLCK